MRRQTLSVLAFFLSIILISCTSSTPHPKRKLKQEEIRLFSKEDAIRWESSHEKLEMTLILMTQADCIHCHRLKKELQRLPDVTVYEFLLSGSSKRAKEYGRQAWCFYQNEKGAPCDLSALDRNHARARKVGITATPAIIFPDGTLNIGWMSASSLKKRLSEHNAK